MDYDVHILSMEPGIRYFKPIVRKLNVEFGNREVCAT